MLPIIIPLSTIVSKSSYIVSSQLTLLSRRVKIRIARLSTNTVHHLPKQHHHHRLTRLRHPAAAIILHPRNATLFSSSSSIEKDVKFTPLVIDQIKSFTIGSFAGLLGSLAGMGGGFVMIPMMTAAKVGIPSSSSLPQNWFGLVKGGLGLNQHQAHGTSLFAVGSTGLAGALGYGIHFNGDSEEIGKKEDADSATAVELQTPQLQTQQRPTNNDRKGVVEMDVAVALATTAMVTARLGAIASSSLSERVLQRALGAFMICVAPLVTGKTYLEEWYAGAEGNDLRLVNNGNKRVDAHSKEGSHNAYDHDNKKNNNTIPQQIIERLLPASLIGMFSGFLSGMFGVGGGSIVVPSLALTTDMSYHSALGTSLCAMVLPAMVGAFTHSKRGNVNWRVAPMLAMGSAVGAYFGGREIGLNVDEGVLRIGFSCLMLVLGVKTWRKGSR